MQLFERVTVPRPTETETRGFQDQDQDQDSKVPRPRPRPRLVKTSLETSRDQDSSLENSKSAPYGRSDLLHFKYIMFDSNFLLGNKYFVTSTSTITSTEGSSTSTSTSTLHASTSTSTRKLSTSTSTKYNKAGYRYWVVS